MYLANFTTNYNIEKVITKDEAKLIQINKTKSLYDFVASRSIHQNDYNFKVGISKINYSDLKNSDKHCFAKTSVIFQIVEIFEGKNQNVILVALSKAFDIK